MNRRTSLKLHRRNKILILCQGRTEEIYFKSFPAVRTDREWLINVFIESHSLDPEQLIGKAIEMRKSAEQNNGQSYNTIWCVFDNDDFKQKFRKGLILADRENIRTAFSIESFELWLLLHFKRVSIDSLLTRDGYIKELRKKGRIPDYEKNELSIKQHISYRKLGKPKRIKALTNSKELETKARLVGRYYSKQNCTIHRLVEFLESLN